MIRSDNGSAMYAAQLHARADGNRPTVRFRRSAFERWASGPVNERGSEP